MKTTTGTIGIPFPSQLELVQYRETIFSETSRQIKMEIPHRLHLHLHRLHHQLYHQPPHPERTAVSNPSPSKEMFSKISNVLVTPILSRSEY
jgi:hypothetical protein